MTDNTTRAAALLEMADSRPLGERAASNDIREAELPKKIEAIIKNWGKVEGVYVANDASDEELLAVYMSEFALFSDSFDKLDQLKKLGLDQITTDENNEVVTDKEGVLLIFYGDAYK